uniref:Uncharacterized protein n=1 Tax=uncultured organism MedDCM-OCT-S06-C2377 TaxID=743624 RepID=D6PKG1_9ZZZZ|nr:hypothetical protein [uncultured organism MedDCM-OCT-S06-C2377]
MATINLGSIKFNWKGTYAGGTAYVVDDVVEYNGSSYVCILASTGNLPTNATYFEQMSSAGTNGTDGTDLTTTLTTRGDIVYKGASALERLAKGTTGQVLKQGTNDPEWGDSGGLTLKKQAFWHDDSFSNIGGSGQLVLTQPYTTKGTNSVFLLDASVYVGHNASINPDVNNITIFAFLEDGSGNKYRFGFYKTSGVYATGATSLSGNYWLEDTDGSVSLDNNWNSQRRSFSNVGGNQTSDQTNYVASTFASGTSLNLKVYLADGGGTNLYYNRSNANSTGHGRSFYAITEIKGYE